MAQKDSKDWLKLFHERWGYQPLAKLTKQKGYRGVTDFDEAMHIYSETENLCLVQIVFPFPLEKFDRPEDRFRNSVAIFPQTVSYEDQFWTIDTPVCFKEKLYSLDQFIKIAPALSVLSAASVFNRYVFSLNCLMLRPNEMRNLLKHLTLPKQQLVKTGIWQNDTGKYKGSLVKKNEERDRFFIKHYIRMGKPKRLPVSELQDLWSDYRKKITQTKSEYDAKEVSDNTIRSLLKQYQENPGPWESAIKEYTL